MRLTEKQAQLIVYGVQRHLGSASRIWLFGSRVDDAKKGCDIDLFVETEAHPLRDALRCKIELEEALDMPVDLIVRGFEEHSPIADIAKSDGQRTTMPATAPSNRWGGRLMPTPRRDSKDKQRRHFIVQRPLAHECVPAPSV
ncbi:MAG: nucleotidyltransferase domain-containing protein [Lamprobacter sp.]|uniref:nucleotidyltransferase family protein n=1 Tax=Lamprobacter sp. TaxID=3100796 RepID=UPI002B262D61|nr:nucleotidyltransferase domain-containing protein [Lamprobacter sp.]MEA3640852.1 nucleotidyltransferase domain-containing protein [Lamprobacter sp.]